MKPTNAMLSVFAVLMLTTVLPGCGTVPESTTDTWDAVPVSNTARLEYRADSLMNENRRLSQQVEALATENRNLNSRSAELETRLTEMASAPKPEPVVMTTTAYNTNTPGYEGALEAFRQRDFASAINGFQTLLVGNVGDNLADNCHYWMGESFYGMKKYGDAIEHFTMVLGYKTSEKKDDAELMIGNSYWAMGDKAAAREAYNKVITSYPTSTLVQKAQEKLSKLN